LGRKNDFVKEPKGKSRGNGDKETKKNRPEPEKRLLKTFLINT